MGNSLSDPKNLLIPFLDNHLEDDRNVIFQSPFSESGRSGFMLTSFRRIEVLEQYRAHLIVAFFEDILKPS